MTDQPKPGVPQFAFAGDPGDATASRSGSRKKASTACSACRARRSKCTGGIPCLSCLSHRTECIKDESEDGRRRIAIKRKLEGLEDDRQILTALIETLKQGNESQISSLIRLLRTTASPHDLSAFLESVLNDSPNNAQYDVGPQNSGNEPAEDKRIGSRPRTGGIVDLLNPPIQVPARPWTRATDDDDFVSHLMSLWFTWIHPWFRWVEQGAFVEAMKSQDIGNPLCASYLVNSILAQACLLDAAGTGPTSYHSVLRQKFLAEAKAGIDAEQGKVSLTIVQAIGVQWCDLYLNGQDRLGRISLNTQSFLIKSLPQWRERIAQNEKKAQLMGQIDTSMDFVNWTSFAVKAFNLADIQDFKFNPEPSSTHPGYPHENAPTTACTTYPLGRILQIEVHPDCQFRSWLSLARLLDENEKMSVKHAEGRSEGTNLASISQGIAEWILTLPSCMQLQEQAMPHVMILHCLYNWVCLVVAKQAAAAEAGQGLGPVITATPASRERLHWQTVAMSQAVAISDTMQSYSRCWGTSHFPALVLQPISVALLALMEDLEQAEHREAFISLAKLLQAVARKYRVARGVIQVTRNVGRTQGITFPAEVSYIFEGVQRRDSEADSSKDGASDQGHSELDLTVNYLLEKWEDLDLNDAGIGD